MSDLLAHIRKRIDREDELMARIAELERQLAEDDELLTAAYLSGFAAGKAHSARQLDEATGTALEEAISTVEGVAAFTNTDEERNIVNHAIECLRRAAMRNSRTALAARKEEAE